MRFLIFCYLLIVISNFLRYFSFIASNKITSMLIDWLKIYQDFDYQLPLLGDKAYAVHDITDHALGDFIATKCPTYQHEGSYSTSVHIRISGNRLTVEGNPSRINRMENLFGFFTIDQCVSVFNELLDIHGLPHFTKATRIWYTQQSHGDLLCCDGAVITEIHITSNKCVGRGAEDDFLKALSTQPYRNSVPRLHTNGKTCDWLTKAGNGGRLIYPSVYNKAFELRLHALPKVLRRFGEDSDEYRYLLSVIEYCEEQGALRYELKLKSEFLRRERLSIYGFIDESKFPLFQQDFLDLDQKLQVEKMSLENLSERLLREGVCSNLKAANATTIYAIQWASGAQFDFKKSQLKTHRARLRKIGIDIALPCDLTKFALVTVRESRLIEVKSLPIPSWYRKPKQLQLVAA